MGMDSTGVNRRWWNRAAPHLAPAVIYAGLAVILGYMAAVSFDHEYQLAHGNGQAGGWVSAGLAVSIDGLLMVASVATLWALAQGIRGPRQLWRPWLALAVGIAATVAANLYAGLHYIWLQRAVSVWSGLAVALGAEVVMWFVDTRRKLAAGDPLQPAPACSHPPPPVTLAELLPLARAHLMNHGLPYGEERVADLIGVARHQVRKAQASAGEPGEVRLTKPPAGTALPSPEYPVPAGLNGKAAGG
jgi:hypothetical protein